MAGALQYFLELNRALIDFKNEFKLDGADPRIQKTANELVALDRCVSNATKLEITGVKDERLFDLELFSLSFYLLSLRLINSISNLSSSALHFGESHVFSDFRKRSDLWMKMHNDELAFRFKDKRDHLEHWEENPTRRDLEPTFVQNGTEYTFALVHPDFKDTVLTGDLTEMQMRLFGTNVLDSLSFFVLLEKDFFTLKTEERVSLENVSRRHGLDKKAVVLPVNASTATGLSNLSIEVLKKTIERRNA